MSLTEIDTEFVNIVQYFTDLQAVADTLETLYEVA